MFRWTYLTALMAAFLVGPALCAANDTWREGTYFKRQVEGESAQISKLLNDFGKAQRVPVIIDQTVDPALAVHVQYPEMKPEEYLDAITQDNGLFWYYSSGVIHVLANTALQSELLPISAVDLDRLIQTLRRLRVYSERLPITADPEYGLVYVIGPNSYIEQVQKIAQGIEFRVRQRASVDVDVEVFPLRYAWADDQVFIIGQNEVAVPGVATIMQNILGNQPVGIGLQGRTSRITPYNRPGLRGRGLIGPYNQIIANAEQAALNSRIAAAEAEARFQASAQAEAEIQAALAAAQNQGGPAEGFEASAQAEAVAQVSGVIMADPRLNAIVIRDVRDRMAGYKEIIEQLDRPVGLVQIKASIIDVDANHAFQLGMPYNAIWRNDGQQRTFQARLDTTNANELLNTPDPGNLTLRLANNDVNQFFLNLKALETDGHARTIAKPAVVTLDNTEAFLEESEEFYVRIAGLEQVDLFNVTVGTKLNIIPHIVYEPDGRRVKLSVRIEDGTRSATQTVDEIPVVSRNSINTQAVLLEGQSLLVGGLMREQETKDIRGVPVLARIPKLGVLFRETVHSTQRLERMVLLTPTLIDLPYYRHCDEPSGRHHINPPDGQSPAGPQLPPYEVIPSPDADAPAGYREDLPPPQTTISQSSEQARRVHSSRRSTERAPIRHQSMALPHPTHRSLPQHSPTKNSSPQHPPAPYPVQQTSFQGGHTNSPVAHPEAAQQHQVTSPSQQQVRRPPKIYRLPGIDVHVDAGNSRPATMIPHRSSPSQFPPRHPASVPAQTRPQP